MSSDSISSVENEQLVGLLRKEDMEARAEHQVKQQYKNLYGFTTVVGCVLVGMVFVWCLVYRGGFAWTETPGLQFNWHPVLMTVGLIFMYSQAMLIYRTGRGTVKKTLKIWHALIHCGAFIFSVIGLVAVFQFHKNTDKPDLYTLHSWLGLISVIIFGLQFVSGFVTFLFPGLSREIRKISLPVHVAVGTGTFILVVCTAFMGLQEKVIWAVGEQYGKFAGEGLLVNFSGLVLGLYAVLVLYLVNNPDYKRVALPEDEIDLVSHRKE